MQSVIDGIKFKCAECNGTVLEEAIINITQLSVIKTADNVWVQEYGDSSYGGGDVGRYQRLGCGKSYGRCLEDVVEKLKQKNTERIIK